MIIQTAFLGDLLLGIPLFKQLRQLQPGMRLTVYCRKGLGDFLLKSGLVDEVVEADKSSRASLIAADRRLRSRDYKLVICPHESFRSALLARRLHAAHKIGYSRWFNKWVFDHRLKRPLELPEALRQLALLEPLDHAWSERLAGCRAEQTAPGGQLGASLTRVPEWASMLVPRLQKLRSEFRTTGKLTSASSERVRAIAERLGFGGSRLAFLAPGSVWRTKQWTPEGYSEVARSFLARGYKVVLIGSPDEKKLCEEVVAAAPGAVSVAGETALWESAELLSLADLLVCNDSGAMHMAAAGGVPTVSVFGPTILDFGYRPWQNEARVVEVPRAELKCRPCGTHGAKSCPLGTHACMKSITAAQVLAAAPDLSK